MHINEPDLIPLPTSDEALVPAQRLPAHIGVANQTLATSGSLEGTSLANLAATGEVEIAGRHYITADRLAAMLGVTARTLGRWDAARIGPPKIKIGRLVLFDLAKL